MGFHWKTYKDLGLDKILDCSQFQENDLRLTFDKYNHIYLYDGKKVSLSCSKLSGFTSHFYGDKWRKTPSPTLQQAQSFGRAIHHLVQKVMEHPNVDFKVILDKWLKKYPEHTDQKEILLKPGFSQFFRRHRKIHTLGTELKLVAPWEKISLAGTIDYVGVEKKEGTYTRELNIYLVDWKTTKANISANELDIDLERAKYFSQLGGYQTLFSRNFQVREPKATKDKWKVNVVLMLVYIDPFANILPIEVAKTDLAPEDQKVWLW